MKHIHIDTDLGGDIDDLCALAMVLHWPDTQITGITVVGDTGGKRTGYVRYVLKTAGREDISAAAGADTSAGYYRYELSLPEESRYWPEPAAASPNDPDTAVELLKNSIEQGAVIAGIGPLTNLSLLEQKYPRILLGAELVLMGGYLTPVPEGCPDWSNEFDFNLQVDVRSARHVLENSHPTLVQLSATANTALRRLHLDALRKANPLCQLIARQAAAFAEDEHMDIRYGHCKSIADDIINFQYDGAACAVALGWRDGVEMSEYRLVYEERDGYLYEVPAENGKRVQVVNRIDGEKFSDLWLRTVISG